MTWASFNNAPRRIQNGGWAREVTQSTFPISDTISGVPPEMVAQHLNVDEATISKWPSDRPSILPA
jgi:hypothetical protein